jgi:flavin reductase (DIM6/NTAB) family NADH-FMN oxidoreductase RutF
MDARIADLDPQRCDQLLNSLIVPRPIAWVTSRDATGRGNLAPFSYFTMVSRFPPIVMVSFTGPKNTLANVVAAEEFVVNVVSTPLAETMVATSADYPAGVDEAGILGIDLAPSVAVAVPRVAASRAALECRLHSVQPVGDGTLVFGEVVHVHVDDAVLRDGRVDPEALQAVGRIGGNYYVTATRPVRHNKPAPAPASPEGVR